MELPSIAAVYGTLIAASRENHGAAPDCGTRIPGNLGGKENRLHFGPTEGPQSPSPTCILVEYT